MYFIACVVDDEGNQQFTAGDYDLLASLPVSIINTVVKAAIELTSATAEEVRKN